MFIDMEHGALGIADVQRMLQSAQANCPCVVRVPSVEEVWIKKVLDTGCEGIIAPLVNSAEEAEKLVALCKYPPEGRRSVGISRAHSYGMDFHDYIEHANDRIAVIAQVY